MWTVCITSIRHVLKLNGYGGRQAKANEKRQRFKGWETLDIHSSASVNTLSFAPKQPLARIDFLRLGGRLVEKIAAIVLKLLLKNGQKKVG